MNRSGVVSSLLAIQMALWPALAETAHPENLRIILLEGEGSINNIQLKTNRDLAVRLEDANNQPVIGATVAFSLPSRGASGTFPNGSTVVTVTTDEQGRAAVHGLKPNQLAGKVEIRVNASYQSTSAAATITQFNMLVPENNKRVKSSGGGKKIVLILVIGGAAAAGGAVAAMHKGGSSPASPGSGVPGPGTPSITITPGTGTVGPPQ